MAARDEWSLAVDAGDVAKLQHLVKSTALKPDGAKAQEAFVLAASRDRCLALEILLNWGTPVEAKNSDGKRALHAAAESGAAAAVALLCSRKADVDRLDGEGISCMHLAIRGKCMPVAKELLRAGASLPHGEAVPGLAAVVREVQLERLATELKLTAQTPEVTAAELQAADGCVWKCQREHMRLLRLCEEQRAGRQLASFEERTTLERATAERSRLLESEQAVLITDKRVELLTIQSDLTIIVKELQGQTSTEMALKAEDEKLKAELKERRDELAELNAGIATSDQAAKNEQESFDVSKARCQSLESEIAEQRRYNQVESVELQTAQSHLQDWLKDREAAAKFTAQAHKLLGN